MAGRHDRWRPDACRLGSRGGRQRLHPPDPQAGLRGSAVPRDVREDAGRRRNPRDLRPSRRRRRQGRWPDSDHHAGPRAVRRDRLSAGPGDAGGDPRHPRAGLHRLLVRRRPHGAGGRHLRLWSRGEVDLRRVARGRAAPDVGLRHRPVREAGRPGQRPAPPVAADAGRPRGRSGPAHDGLWLPLEIHVQGRRAADRPAAALSSRAWISFPDA